MPRIQPLPETLRGGGSPRRLFYRPPGPQRRLRGQRPPVSGAVRKLGPRSTRRVPAGAVSDAIQAGSHGLAALVTEPAGRASRRIQSRDRADAPRSLRRDASEAGHDGASRDSGGWPPFLTSSACTTRGSAKRDVQTIDGVRVTTPVRTLIDVIAEGVIAPELQVQAVDQALRRGLVMRRQLETARVSTRARQRIDRILKQVPDGSSTPVHHRRLVSNRT